MLRNIFSLTKVFLSSSFRSGNRKKNKIGRILLYAGLFAYLGGIFGYLSYEMIRELSAIRQEAAFISIVLMMIISLTMLTTIVAIINVFYFSNDNLHVMPLPLKPYEVLSAKLNTLLIYQYMEETAFVSVPLVIYGILTGQGFLYYPFALIILLVIPIVPLLGVSLIVMAVMALLKGIRNKSLVQVFTMGVTMIFSLAMSTAISTSSNNDDVMQLIGKSNGIVEIYNKVFPTMPLAYRALQEKDILSLLVLILLSVLVYGLVCFFGHKLYYRGMLGSLFSSSGVSGKQIDEKNAYSSRGLVFSYVMKEVKVYLRNPTFFIQLLLPSLLLPWFIIGLFYMQFSRQMDLPELLGYLYAEKSYSIYVFAVLLLTFFFVGIYCFIPALAVSKDGKDAYIMKYLPVPFYKQILYKAIPDILQGLIVYLEVVICALILFRLPVIHVLYSLPLVLSYCVLHSLLIVIDVRDPKLNWTSEIQVVKNNLRTLVEFAFVLGNGIIVALLAFLVKLPVPLLTLIMSAAYLISIFFLYRYIRNRDILLAGSW